MNRRGESVFVAVLLIFSAAALWQAYSIAGFEKWSSPGVFPMLAAATMLICSLFIYRDAIRNRRSTQLQQEHPESVTDRQVECERLPTDSTRILPTEVVAVTIGLILYIAAMPTLGFTLDSFLFLFASITYLWKKPIWLAFLVSGASLVVIHIIFRLVFQVILPHGSIIELLR